MTPLGWRKGRPPRRQPKLTFNAVDAAAIQAAAGHPRPRATAHTPEPEAPISEVESLPSRAIPKKSKNQKKRTHQCSTESSAESSAEPAPRKAKKSNMKPAQIPEEAKRRRFEVTVSVVAPGGKCLLESTSIEWVRGDKRSFNYQSFVAKESKAAVSDTVKPTGFTLWKPSIITGSSRRILYRGIDGRVH